MEKRKIIEVGLLIGVLVVGIFRVLYKYYLDGGILILLVGVYLGSEKYIRDSATKVLMIIFDLLREEKSSNSQNMEKSSGGFQNQAGRDINNTFIIGKKDLITKKHNKNNSEEFDALKEVFDKMTNSYMLLSKLTHNGVKSKKEFDHLSKVIEDFINIKIKREILFEEEISRKLSDVIASFCHNKNELYRKVIETKFNEGLIGSEFFIFTDKFNEVKLEIKKILNNP